MQEKEPDDHDDDYEREVNTSAEYRNYHNLLEHANNKREKGVKYDFNI